MKKGLKRVLCFLFVFQSVFLSWTGSSFGQKNDFLRIDSVSVKPGPEGRVVIGWTLQTSENVSYIEIHRQLPNNTYGLIYTLNDLSISYFIDNGVDGGQESHSYFLAAFDEHEHTIAVSKVHRTTFLQEPEADFCLEEILLFWENYEVTTSAHNPIPQMIPFDVLNVQVSADGIDFESIITFNQSDANGIAEEYKIQGLDPGQYYFRIQNYDSESEITSSSNVRIYGYHPPRLKDFRINYIDVFENQEVHVSFSANGNPYSFNYEVYCSSEEEGEFVSLPGLHSLGIVKDIPDLTLGPWFYKVKAWLKNWECEAPVYETSGIFSSIYLKSAPGIDSRSYKFSWEHFYPEDLMFSYRLLMMDGEGGWVLVPGFVDDGMQSFLFEAPMELVGPLVFKLGASKDSGPLQEISSNYLVIEIEPKVFIPNAIRPNSQEIINAVFKPIFLGFNPQEYELIIFNRWGQQIFRSTNENLGWNGKHDGKSVPPGFYSYQLRYRVPDGKVYEKRGGINLVY